MFDTFFQVIEVVIHTWWTFSVCIHHLRLFEVIEYALLAIENSHGLRLFFITDLFPFSINPLTSSQMNSRCSRKIRYSHHPHDLRFLTFLVILLLEFYFRLRFLWSSEDFQPILSLNASFLSILIGRFLHWWPDRRFPWVYQTII